MDPKEVSPAQIAHDIQKPHGERVLTQHNRTRFTAITYDPEVVHCVYIANDQDTGHRLSSQGWPMKYPVSSLEQASELMAQVSAILGVDAPSEPLDAEGVDLNSPIFLVVRAIPKLTYEQ